MRDLFFFCEGGGLGTVARYSLCACTPVVVTPPASLMINASDWPSYNRTHAGDRFSPLKEIDRSNVGIIAYAAGGRQLLGVASGMKSPIWPGGAKQSRILVYGLR